MKRPSLSMKRALGGAAKALGGTKGSKYQLTVEVEAVRLPAKTAREKVVVELERGTRRSTSSVSSVEPAASADWGPPLHQVVTLFRDAKSNGFRPKPFTIRVRQTKDDGTPNRSTASLLATCGPLDASEYVVAPAGAEGDPPAGAAAAKAGGTVLRLDDTVAAAKQAKAIKGGFSVGGVGGSKVVLPGVTVRVSCTFLGDAALDDLDDDASVSGLSEAGSSVGGTGRERKFSSGGEEQDLSGFTAIVSAELAKGDDDDEDEEGGEGGGHHHGRKDALPPPPPPQAEYDPSELFSLNQDSLLAAAMQKEDSTDSAVSSSSASSVSSPRVVRRSASALKKTSSSVSCTGHSSSMLMSRRLRGAAGGGSGDDEHRDEHEVAPSKSPARQATSRGAKSQPRAQMPSRITERRSSVPAVVVVEEEVEASSSAAAASSSAPPSSRVELGGGGRRAAGREVPQSPSPFRHVAAAEELARQLTVAKSERDDALFRLKTAQLAAADAGGDDLEAQAAAEAAAKEAAEVLEKMKQRAEQAEASLGVVRAEKSAAESEARSSKAALARLEELLKDKDAAVVQALEESVENKAKSAAADVRAATTEKLLEGLQKKCADTEAKLAEAQMQLSTMPKPSEGKDDKDKDGRHEEAAESNGGKRASDAQAAVATMEALVASLKEQLELKRDAHEQTKAELAKSSEEVVELREAAAAATGAARQASAARKQAEDTIKELEAEIASMEADKNEEAELAEAREGAMRATAQFRIKELETQVSELTASLETAKSNAVQDVESLKGVAQKSAADLELTKAGALAEQANHEKTKNQYAKAAVKVGQFTAETNRLKRELAQAKGAAKAEATALREARVSLKQAEEGAAERLAQALADAGAEKAAAVEEAKREAHEAAAAAAAASEATAAAVVAEAKASSEKAAVKEVSVAFELALTQDPEKKDQAAAAAAGGGGGRGDALLRAAIKEAAKEAMGLQAVQVQKLRFVGQEEDPSGKAHVQVVVTGLPPPPPAQAANGGSSRSNSSADGAHSENSSPSSSFETNTSPDASKLPEALAERVTQAGYASCAVAEAPQVSASEVNAAEAVVALRSQVATAKADAAGARASAQQVVGMVVKGLQQRLRGALGAAGVAVPSPSDPATGKALADGAAPVRTGPEAAAALEPLVEALCDALGERQKSERELSAALRRIEGELAQRDTRSREDAEQERQALRTLGEAKAASLEAAHAQSLQALEARAAAAEEKLLKATVKIETLEAHGREQSSSATSHTTALATAKAVAEAENERLKGRVAELEGSVASLEEGMKKANLEKKSLKATAVEAMKIVEHECGKRVSALQVAHEVEVHDKVTQVAAAAALAASEEHAREVKKALELDVPAVMASAVEHARAKFKKAKEAEAKAAAKRGEKAPRKNRQEEEEQVQRAAAVEVAGLVWERLRGFAKLDKRSAKRIFHSFDEDDSGVLNEPEFAQALEEMGISGATHAVLQEVMECADGVGDGNLSIDEFTDTLLDFNPVEALETMKLAQRQEAAEHEKLDKALLAKKLQASQKQLKEMEQALSEAKQKSATAPAAAPPAPSVVEAQAMTKEMKREKEEMKKVVAAAKKKEKELRAKEAALEYDQLRAADKEQEMLDLVVASKMQAAQAKEQVDSLQRENSRMSAMLSDTKGQLANFKAAHEDLEVNFQHAIAERKAAEAEAQKLRSGLRFGAAKSLSSSLFSKS